MKCKKCGYEKPKLYNKETKTWDWKQLWKVDWKAMLFLIWVLYMVWAFKHDTEYCMDVIENPKEYCDGYCSQKDLNRFIDDGVIEIGEIQGTPGAEIVESDWKLPDS